MNERGFFTIIGLCLLIVIAFSVKNIQETESIYFFGTADFQAEHELQKVAEDALFEAAEIVRKNHRDFSEKKIITEILPVSSPYGLPREYQNEIPVTAPEKSDRLKNVSVEVWGQRGEIYHGSRKFSDGKTIDTLDKNDLGKEIHSEGIVLISVASCDSDLTGEKIYRRAFAYVLENDPTHKIHFMNSN